MMMRMTKTVATCLLLAACASQPKPVPAAHVPPAKSEPLVLDVTDPYRFYSPDATIVVFPYDYPNYNAYLEGYVKHFHWWNLPKRLQWKWRACIVGYSNVNFNDPEWWELAAFAHGDTKMTAGELTEYHHRMARRAGPNDIDLENDIRDYCPETVQALMPYIEQGTYKTVFKW
jgi:hypothetical protein